MKKWLALLLVAVMALSAFAAAEEAAEELQAEDAPVELYPGEDGEDYDELVVGSATPLRGQFFTSMWGNSTSDIDVRDLLNGYSLAVWDREIGHYHFNDLVVNSAMVVDDELGDRCYILSLYDDLFYSDGTPVTAWDYAFSVLLQCDPAIAELGGRPAGFDYLYGIEDYLSGEAKGLFGVQVMDDHMLMFTVKSDALPYFYELSRMAVNPYPIAAIAPGCKVYDDGEGAYIANADPEAAEPVFTVQLLEKTIMDPQTGYLVHPDPCTGPYCIESFDGTTATFTLNRHFKGDPAGAKPRIRRLVYTLADNDTMLEGLQNGDFGLLNKVTRAATITEGMQMSGGESGLGWMNYPRVGLTYIYFSQRSLPLQEAAVRQAIACCMDRPQLVRDYVGGFGVEALGFYGLGQWMAGLVNGTTAYPIEEPAEGDPQDAERYDAELMEWEALSVDALDPYALDLDRAAALLDAAGWTLGEDGMRAKEIDGAMVPLVLTLAVPEGNDMLPAFEELLVPNLAQIGVSLTLVPTDMNALQDAHTFQELAGADMFYLGDNFDISFDPSRFFRPGDGDEEAPAEASLAAAHAELYALATDMCRTEPTDVLGFMHNWVTFQERTNELLPLLPVYSNVYFDFFNRDLHGYDIDLYSSWAQAIVPARYYPYVPEVEEEEMEIEEADKLEDEAEFDL